MRTDRRRMRSLFLFSVPLSLLTHPAAAAGVMGNSALALSALVAANSPVLSAGDKRVMAALFDGQIDVPLPAGKKISVQADGIICKAGDVDITHHACTLAFGKQTSTLTGRAAHEFFATMIEVGVQPEGAAGAMYAGISHLNCTVDPNEVEQQDGGGATCNFDADPATSR